MDSITWPQLVRQSKPGQLPLVDGHSLGGHGSFITTGRSFDYRAMIFAWQWLWPGLPGHNSFFLVSNSQRLPSP